MENFEEVANQRLSTRQRRVTKSAEAQVHLTQVSRAERKGKKTQDLVRRNAAAAKAARHNKTMYSDDGNDEIQVARDLMIAGAMAKAEAVWLRMGIPTHVLPIVRREIHRGLLFAAPETFARRMAVTALIVARHLTPRLYSADEVETMLRAAGVEPNPGPTRGYDIEEPEQCAKVAVTFEEAGQRRRTVAACPYENAMIYTADLPGSKGPTACCPLCGLEVNANKSRARRLYGYHRITVMPEDVVVQQILGLITPQGAVPDSSLKTQKKPRKLVCSAGAASAADAIPTPPPVPSAPPAPVEVVVIPAAPPMSLRPPTPRVAKPSQLNPIALRSRGAQLKKAGSKRTDICEARRSLKPAEEKPELVNKGHILRGDDLKIFAAKLAPRPGCIERALLWPKTASTDEPARSVIQEIEELQAGVRVVTDENVKAQPGKVEVAHVTVQQRRINWLSCCARAAIGVLSAPLLAVDAAILAGKSLAAVATFGAAVLHYGYDGGEWVDPRPEEDGSPIELCPVTDAAIGAGVALMNRIGLNTDATRIEETRVQYATGILTAVAQEHGPGDEALAANAVAKVLRSASLQIPAERALEIKRGTVAAVKATAESQLFQSGRRFTPTVRPNIVL